MGRPFFVDRCAKEAKRRNISEAHFINFRSRTLGAGKRGRRLDKRNKSDAQNTAHTSASRERFLEKYFPSAPKQPAHKQKPRHPLKKKHNTELKVKHNLQKYVSIISLL